MTSQPPGSIASDWIGQHIGNYRLVKMLGEGGMGMVFEAVHDGVGGRAAIKLLRPEITNREDLVARFFNEARAANASQHPGIVKIFDSGYTAQGVAFLCMEYLEGESLRSRLARINQFELADALRVCRQIASALLAAHRKNIVHRDLKPDNIMLVPDPELPGGERVKILDFGIAKMAEGLGATPLYTKTDLLMGTPTYMAPEQCRGAKGVTDRSDVYSLGVILYKMLASRPPFLSRAAGELIAMHLVDPVPPLLELAPHVGSPTAALVHSMLEKEQALRPSMERVVDTLQRLEKSLSIIDASSRVSLEETTEPVVSIPVKSALLVPPIGKPQIQVAPPGAPTTRAKVVSSRATVVKAEGRTVVARLIGPKRWIALTMLGGVCAIATTLLIVMLTPSTSRSVIKAKPSQQSSSPTPAHLPVEAPGPSSPPRTALPLDKGPSDLERPDVAPSADKIVSDPFLLAAKKALKSGHYLDAINATRRCGKENQLQATRIRALAACHLGDFKSVEESRAWLRANKSQAAVTSIQEIEKECASRDIPKISVLKSGSNP